MISLNPVTDHPGCCGFLTTGAPACIQISFSICDPILKTDIKMNYISSYQYQ